MTARKSLAYLLLGACLALSCAQVGCGLLGSDEQAQSERPQQMSIAEAQKVAADAKSKLASLREMSDRLNDELVEARKKAADLKTKWEADRVLTVRQKKNPDDPKQAPNTVATKKAYEAAADDAEKKAGELAALTSQEAKAREDLRAAEAVIAGSAAGAQGSGGGGGGSGEKPTSSEEPRNEGMFAGLATLAPILLALLCLGLLGFLLWKLLRLQDSLADLDDLIHKSHGKQAVVLQKLDASASALSDVPSTLAKLMGEVSRLREIVSTDRLERLRQGETTAREAANSAAYGAAQRDAASGYGEPVDFPISAGAFLARIPDQQQMPIKLDPLKNILVRDQEGLGLLMLVRDMSVRGGQLCMVPGMERLQTAQEYHYNYEMFYQCSRPAAGEVWINKPALVGKVDGGWKLLEIGQLEVR